MERGHRGMHHDQHMINTAGEVQGLHVPGNCNALLNLHGVFLSSCLMFCPGGCSMTSSVDSHELLTHSSSRGWSTHGLLDSCCVFSGKTLHPALAFALPIQVCRPSMRRACAQAVPMRTGCALPGSCNGCLPDQLVHDLTKREMHFHQRLCLLSRSSLRPAGW